MLSWQIFSMIQNLKCMWFPVSYVLNSYYFTMAKTINYVLNCNSFLPFSTLWSTVSNVELFLSRSSSLGKNSTNFCVMASLKCKRSFQQIAWPSSVPSKEPRYNSLQPGRLPTVWYAAPCSTAAMSNVGSHNSNPRRGR